MKVKIFTTELISSTFQEESASQNATRADTLAAKVEKYLEEIDGWRKIEFFQSSTHLGTTLTAVITHR